jgi:DNA-binding transcriptional regulator GbsR (MarR family)
MTLNQIHGTTDLSQQIKEKEQELDMLLDGEEMWWKQRSRADWLQHGDKNTRFFHMKASQRRKRNKISEIKDNQGTVWTDSADIERVLMDHFRTLFTKQDTQQIAQTVEVVKDRLNHDMKEHLSTNFTEEEVYNAIKDMKSMAAPGPDGLPALFYHTY